MLKSNTRTSFYLDNELVDIEMLMFLNRNCGGGSIHKKNQAICKLRIVASELEQGYGFEDEISIRKWLREL